MFNDEIRKLDQAGRNDLAAKVYHTSKDRPTNPWDIGSYEKVSPFNPIRIEVKANPDDESLTFPM